MAREDDGIKDIEKELNKLARKKFVLLSRLLVRAHKYTLPD